MNNSHHSVNPFSEVAISLKSDLSAFKSYLVKQASTFEREVRVAAKEAITPKGKYIRPMLVFSSALGANKKSLIRRATIAELVHLSTLIHDDVIDNATLRRNEKTAYEKYGAKTAILLGDSIFAHMMSLAFEENDMEVLKRTAECVKTICEGEIKQTLADKTKIVSRKKYYDVAYGKTAALFEFACHLGASASKSASNGWENAARECGKQLGIAYQIYDDICDWFMSESDAGKTLGTDLVSGKQTYPLIILLEKVPSATSSKLAKNLQNESPEKIALMLRDFDVLKDCEKEFFRRISLAEKAINPFKKENAKLAKFCEAMRELKIA